jgi:hypothetical protein
MEAEGTAVKVASMMVALADVAATRLHELDASLSSSLCLYLHLCLSPSLVLSRGGFHRKRCSFGQDTQSQARIKCLV